MLPFPPLAGLQETIRFLLPHVAEVTGAEEVVICLDVPDLTGRCAVGYGAGKFFDPHAVQYTRAGLVFIPLRAGGWLTLYGAKKPFDRQVLEQYCSQALENAVKYESVQQQAMVDVLTGLPNRAALYRKLQEEVKRLYRFCVLFADLDGFKQINDTYGHLMGDDVLKKAAEEIRSALRASDFLARYGGDEFVAVLSETTSERGELVASRIRSMAVKVGDVWVSVSVGLAVYPEDGLTPKDLIGRADSRMYMDKGKNRGDS
ncbi:GGDEF domain-containing protein [Desulfofundulus sp.]|uniref:GGDEF domain-containing protein n=1 Tax=Desulfofundulus sp. TaxID=2282750 RepID=UPI003C71F2A0